MNKAQVGKRGEQAAARYLRRHGYQILERNIHVSHQEIDIIAVNRDVIAFVEVKTRTADPQRSDWQSAPGAAVNYEKQGHLLRAAKNYLRNTGSEQQPRMDVIEVYLAPDHLMSRFSRFWERLTGVFGIPQRKVLHIHHIENAFGLYGYRP